MIAKLAILSAIISSVVAQGNVALEIESIDAQFSAAYIVPDLFTSFDPQAYLTLNFAGTTVAPGTLLTVEEAGVQPEITVTAPTGTDLGTTFTLALVDPGAIGGANGQQTRHWLVNGVTIGEGGLLVIPDGAITPYGGPYPPDTDSAHRYVFLLYEQPANFASTLTAPQEIAAFDVNEYATGSNLGPVVAASYFTCSRSTLAAVTTTSAVNTATLPAAASGSSSAGSSTRTGSGSTAAPTTTTGSNSAGFSNAASMGVAGLMAFLGVALA